MHQTIRHERTRANLRRNASIAAAAALLLTFGAGTSRAGEKAEVNLRSTVEAPRAKGRARLSVRGNSEGRSQIRAQQLERESEYEVIVGGVKVAVGTMLRSARRPHGRRPHRTEPGASLGTIHPL